MAAKHQPKPLRPLNETRKLPARAALPLEERRVTQMMAWRGVFEVDGVQVSFSTQESFTVGRSITPSTSQIHLDLTPYGALDKGVSRMHIQVMAHANCLSIKDLGSTNGTLLNSYTLKPFVEVPLLDGDVIELGSLTLKVGMLLAEASA